LSGRLHYRTRRELIYVGLRLLRQLGERYFPVRDFFHAGNNPYYCVGDLCGDPNFPDSNTQYRCMLLGPHRFLANFESAICQRRDNSGRVRQNETGSFTIIRHCWICSKCYPQLPDKDNQKCDDPRHPPYRRIRNMNYANLGTTGSARWDSALCQDCPTL